MPNNFASQVASYDGGFLCPRSAPSQTKLSPVKHSWPSRLAQKRDSWFSVSELSHAEQRVWGSMCVSLLCALTRASWRSVVVMQTELHEAPPRYVLVSNSRQKLTEISQAALP